MQMQEQKQNLPLSPTVIWLLRIILLSLFAVWLGGAFYLHEVVKADRAAIAQREQEIQQREDRARRAAAYDQSRIERKLSQHTETNAIDRLNKR